MEKISFVIPCYKSEGYIKPVINEIVDIMGQKNTYDYEIVCTNDHSPDNVLDVLRGIAAENEKIKVVSLAKNFGQAAAFVAALNYVSGDYVVFLDDDGQCPMDHLDDMIQPLLDGYDVAFAKYPHKKQSAFKNFGSQLNQMMLNWMVEKDKGVETSNFISAKRYITDEVIKYKGPYPYIEGLLLRQSKNVANVPMEERERMEGGTTFTFKKLVSLWVNGFTALSVKPLRFSMVAGCIIALLGFLYGIRVIFEYFTDSVITDGWYSLMAVNLFLGGIVLMVLGLIGEYIGRIYMTLVKEPQFVVSETINIAKKED